MTEFYCFNINRPMMCHHAGTKKRRPNMVFTFILFLTLDGLGTLIGMFGTIVGIRFQLAHHFKKSGRGKKKSKHRRRRYK